LLKHAAGETVGWLKRSTTGLKLQGRINLKMEANRCKAVRGLVSGGIPETSKSAGVKTQGTFSSPKKEAMQRD